MEWTNEQRDLPPLDFSPEDRVGAAEDWQQLDYSDLGDVRLLQASFWCRERQLTAALSEAQRLRGQLAKSDTQVGELAVGGAKVREDALRDALNAVAQERLECHNRYLKNPNSLDIDGGDAAHSHAINDCEVAITKLMSAPPSGEQIAIAENGRPADFNKGDELQSGPSGEQAAK